MKNTKLPVHVTPGEDELLTSWMLRLVRKMQTKYHTFCEAFFPNESIDTRDIDLYSKQSLIDRLAELTYIDRSRFESMVFGGFNPNLSNDNIHKWVLSRGNQHRIERNNYISFCPSCFKEDEEPFYRRSWRLIPMVLCTKHNTSLIDCCPSCNAPIRYLRLDIGRKEKILSHDICICSSCGFDFRKSKVLEPEEDQFLIQFQQILKKALVSGTGPDGIYSNLYFDGIYQLMKVFNSKGDDKRYFDEVISRESGYPELRRLSRRYWPLQQVILSERRNIISKVAWILLRHPEEFIDICRQNGITAHTLLYEGEESPYWYYRWIKSNLSVKFSEWKKQYPEFEYKSSYKKLIEVFDGESKK